MPVDRPLPNIDDIDRMLDIIRSEGPKLYTYIPPKLYGGGFIPNDFKPLLHPNESVPGYAGITNIFLRAYSEAQDRLAMEYIIIHFESCSADFMGDFELVLVRSYIEGDWPIHLMGIKCLVCNGQSLIEPGFRD